MRAVAPDADQEQLLGVAREAARERRRQQLHRQRPEGTGVAPLAHVIRHVGNGAALASRKESASGSTVKLMGLTPSPTTI